MKLVLIGDTHFDKSSNAIDNEIIYNNQIKIYNNLVFPIMKERGIKQIVQYGDFTDKRTQLSTFIQHQIKEDIFDILEKNDYTLNYLIGNHDIFYSTSRSIYTLEVFKKAYPNNFKVFDNPMLWKFDDKSKTFLFVPWLLDDEKDYIQKILKDSKPDMIFGHFEISDFYLSKNSKDIHGLDRNYFKNIPVLTGHYHLKQEANNINYIGTPYQTTFEDFNELKGIYILDTETLEIEFIENDITMKHLKVYLNSEDKTMEVHGIKESIKTSINSKTDYSIFKDHKIKVFINKDNVFNKKVIDIISGICFKIKVDIRRESISDDTIDEEIDINKEFNIKNTIYKNLQTDFQKEVFEDIYRKSELELK